MRSFPTGLTAPAPVVALDIDARPDDLGPGWDSYLVESPAVDVPQSPFVAGHGEV